MITNTKKCSFALWAPFMERQRGLWRADWVKGEIEFHKIRETEKETEMVETNFLPSPGLLQGRNLWVGKAVCKLKISPYIQQLVQFTLIWAVNVYSFRSLNTYMSLNVQFKRHEHMEFWYYFDTSNMTFLNSSPSLSTAPSDPPPFAQLFGSADTRSAMPTLS